MEYNSEPINKNYLYELLGCDELSTEEQIIVEYKIKAKSLHPDKNSGDRETAEEFIRISKAKDILCNKDQRKDYDTWRHSGLDIPFETWLQTVKANNMCFHWAPEPKKEKMLESSHTECDTMNAAGSDITMQRTTRPSSFWERKKSWENTKLNKFRNYML